MAGARRARDRGRAVPRPVLARPLAVAAAARPRHRRCSPSSCWPRRGRAAVPRPLAEHDRRPAPARPRQRPAAPAGDRDRRRAGAGERAIRFRVALWRAHVERALRAARNRSRPARRARGLPRAIRSRCARWSLMLVVATFFAAGGERVKRIAAAFDWHGVVAPANFRVDAWVTPPTYTGRPPVILPGSAPGEPRAGRAAPVTVPAGSMLVVRATGTSRARRRRRAAASPKRAGERAPHAAGGHRGAPLHHHGARHRDRARRSATTSTWTFSAIPDRAPTIALAKEPEPQARGSLLLTYKIEDDYGVVEAQATFARKPKPAPTAKRAASALRRAGLPAGAAAGAHPQRRRPDHQGPDRASLGRRRRDDDAGRPRRGRQRRPQRAARDAAAGAAVRQAAGARADRAAPQSRARRRRQGPRAHRARRADDRAGALHAGAAHLSRPALDLLAAHARQDRRRLARRGGAAVGDGGDDRGRQRLRRRGGACARRRTRCARRWSAAPPTKRSRS